MLSFLLAVLRLSPPGLVLNVCVSDGLLYHCTPLSFLQRHHRRCDVFIVTSITSPHPCMSPSISHEALCVATYVIITPPPPDSFSIVSKYFANISSRHSQYKHTDDRFPLIITAVEYGILEIHLCNMRISAQRESFYIAFSLIGRRH